MDLLMEVPGWDSPGDSYPCLPQTFVSAETKNAKRGHSKNIASRQRAEFEELVAGRIKLGSETASDNQPAILTTKKKPAREKLSAKPTAPSKTTTEHDGKLPSVQRKTKKRKLETDKIKNISLLQAGALQQCEFNPHHAKKHDEAAKRDASKIKKKLKLTSTENIDANEPPDEPLPKGTRKDRKKQNSRKRDESSSLMAQEARPLASSPGSVEMPPARDVGELSSAPVPPKKAKKQKKTKAAALANCLTEGSADMAAGKANGGEEIHPIEAHGTEGATPGEGSSLFAHLERRLHSSRFRWLNEQLYTQPGTQAYDLLQSQPELFTQYHQGFLEATKLWPQQPVDVAIDWLNTQPDSWVVADFGCGDAKIAATVKQKVHSFDLVSTVPSVVACNMARVPLGSASVDAAIFCLALMGTDYPSFLREAGRVLKPGGWLWVAEVRSRFVDNRSARDDLRPFISALSKVGFKCVHTDAANTMFAVMRFKKISAGGSDAARKSLAGIPWPDLKPCVYKRR